MISRTDIDFAIASGSEDRFDDLLRLPGYQWDRIILVPKDHELTRLERKVSLHDIAKYPLVSYVFSVESEQSLRKMFESEGLEANIVFTARDSEVIKTYVRMGLGIGIVAGMAYEPADRQSLSAIPVSGLFPRSTTWIGLRRNTVLRCYMADFLRLFAPHLNAEQIERVARAGSQQEVEQLTRGAGLPIRNGFSGNLSAAA